MVGWWLTNKEEPGARSAATTPSPASASATSPATVAADVRSSPAARRQEKPVIAPEVQRLRTRVLESLSAKPEASGSATIRTKQAAGNLKDHTGELNPETMRILSQELMPMVQECYEHAHERNPKLGGMLALNVELAGAEGFGTIIESVEPASDLNQLEDDELIDCVRQSAFSLQLPQPLKSGRAARQLTMPFGEPATAR